MCCFQRQKDFTFAWKRWGSPWTQVFRFYLKILVALLSLWISEYILGLLIAHYDPNYYLLYAVYDLTIAYKNRCPSFLDNVFGTEPSEVHIHVRRIPVGKIPSSEKEANRWLMDAFQFKDSLLYDFANYGHFPDEGTEEELSTLRCFVNFAAVTIITGIFTFLTFFSSIWFKVYVGVVCTFLASATYFGIRPFATLNLCKIDSREKKTV